MALGGKPYTDKIISDNQFIRTLSNQKDLSEFEWHCDHHNRIVEVIDGEDWQLQHDNQLPITIKPGDKFSIIKETYHRIIPGTTDLTLRITEKK